MATNTPQVPFEAEALAQLYPHLSERHRDHIVLPQMRHRIELVKFWDIKPGERILEVGCGQGDCTVTLAAAVGGNGYVTAIDPASLDYGSPYTLGQAQTHIKGTLLGPRINFVQADPLTHLRATTDVYDAAVICHCIWYFSSPSYLQELLATLASRCKRICVAEWALAATDPRSVPHLLAALTQASLECRKPTSLSNIRTVVSPAAIHAIAEAVGLKETQELVFTPNEGMMDGSWEVDAVLGADFAEQVEDSVHDAREKAVVVAMRDAVRASVDALKGRGQKVKSMEVWAAHYATDLK